MRQELIQEYYESQEYLNKLRNRLTNLKKMTEDQFYREKMMVDVYPVEPIRFIEDFCFVKFTEFGGHPKPFFMFPYQKDIITTLQEDYLTNTEVDRLIDKPRGMGLTWLLTVNFLHSWLFRPNWSALILSRTESEVDDGTQTPDASIFGKMRWELSMLPRWMMPEGFKPKDGKGTATDSSLRMINPQMETIIAGSSTNSNAGRSRRYSQIMVDECFYIENFTKVNRALNSVARHKIYVSTTVESKSAKDFKEMCEARGTYTSLTWKDHPFKDEKWYEELHEKARLLDDPDLLREAEVNYNVSSKNQYYPQVAESVTEPAIYERERPLYVSLDMGGRKDFTVIGYWQFDGKYFKLLESYENTNKPTEWYAPFLVPNLPYNKDHYNEFQQEFIKKVNSMNKPVAYFGELDHTIKRRPTNTSDADVLRPYGVNIRYNQYAIQFAPRRQATAQLLPRMIFNSESDAVLKVYDAIMGSKYAGNENTVNEQLKPIHGSDGTADRRCMVENFAVNIGRILRNQRNEEMSDDTRSFARGVIQQLRV